MSDATRIVTAPLSWDDYVALPESQPPFEIVHGQPVVNPTPVGPHQRAVWRLGRRLEPSLPAGHEIVPSPWDWVLWRVPELLVRQADLVVVTHEQADIPRLESPPLLAVEILSPDGFERDVVTKRAEYGRAGLQHYWIVDLEVPEVVVYRAVGTELVELTRAAGHDTLRVEQPFPFAVEPTALIGHR